MKITVWMFVRLMVRLEADAEAGRPSAVYARWRAVWQELDARLDALRQAEPEAFAELMMDQAVEVTLAGAAERAEALAALDRVVEEIEAALAGEPEEDAADDLNFERAGLRDLRAALASAANSA